MNLFENLQLLKENDDSKMLSKIYNLLTTKWKIDKHVNNFEYNKDYETFTFNINVGDSDKYIGEYTIFTEDDEVGVYHWTAKSNEPEESMYTIDEFDNYLSDMDLYLSINGR